MAPPHSVPEICHNVILILLIKKPLTTKNWRQGNARDMKCTGFLRQVHSYYILEGRRHPRSVRVMSVYMVCALADEQRPSSCNSAEMLHSSNHWGVPVSVPLRFLLHAGEGWVWSRTCIPALTLPLLCFAVPNSCTTVSFQSAVIQ